MISSIIPFDNDSLLAIRRKYLRSPWARDRQIFHYLMWWLSRAGCSKVLVEERYVDRDFSSDYGAFHHSVFLDPGKHCVRLHFFSAEADEALHFLSENNRDTERLREHLDVLQSSYRGFLVVLPIPTACIGRTVLTPALQNESRRYYTALVEQHVNLAGVPLKISGIPFIQQDPQVGVCSSASIWMAARYLHSDQREPAQTLSAITHAANKYFRISREFPATRGLTVEQIVSALVELGHFPYYYDKSTFPNRASWNPKEIIYKYMESGFPVIAIIGGRHACVVVGHDFDHTFRPEGTSKLVSASAFIRNFVVHDDELGPYMLMHDTIEQSSNAVKYQITDKYHTKNNYEDFFEEPNRYTPYWVKHVTAIIVPAAKKVHLEAQQVEDLLSRTVEDMDLKSLYDSILEAADNEGDSDETIMSSGTRQIIREFVDLLMDDDKKLLYRARVVASNDFKRDYLIEKRRVSPELSAVYSLLELPRYIWLIEISTMDVYLGGSARNGTEKLIVGEVILDATGDDHSDSVIAFHLPGFVSVNPLFDPASGQYARKAFNREQLEKERGLADVIYTIFDERPYELFDRETRSK